MKFFHGESCNGKESSELMTYKSAKQRCNNKKDAGYKNYGGRGIQFKFHSFAQFLKELGRRPSGKMLDRINNNGHYEPGNVRWATRKEQNLNKRPYSRKSHCKQGHPVSPEDTYIWHKDRRCRICMAATMQRYKNSSVHHHRKTHCKLGHEFTKANTYLYKAFRHCRICCRLRREKFESKKGLRTS